MIVNTAPNSTAFKLKIKISLWSRLVVSLDNYFSGFVPNVAKIQSGNNSIAAFKSIVNTEEIIV